MTDLEIAWDKLKEDLKHEKPFKWIYIFTIKILDWLAKVLEK